MTVHIYRARTQPATRFSIESPIPGGRRMVIRIPPRKALYAHCCKRKRIAKNLVVQVYYDDVRASCADGRGCKA
jgi:hypothetical protein